MKLVGMNFAFLLFKGNGYLQITKFDPLLNYKL